MSRPGQDFDSWGAVVASETLYTLHYFFCWLPRDCNIMGKLANQPRFVEAFDTMWCEARCFGGKCLKECRKNSRYVFQNFACT